MHESVSKQNPQSTTKSSEFIQVPILILHILPKTAVSKKPKSDKKKAAAIADVDKKQEPETPMKRPKKIQEKTLKKGKTSIQKYIKK